MKKLSRFVLIIIILFAAVLLSYRMLLRKINGNDIQDFYAFIEEGSFFNNRQPEKSIPTDYRAVWVSYIEFNEFRNQTEENNENHFREYFSALLDRCEELNINTVIVQVRPFGDALYQSDYYPWAACISGQQGTDPGYDPLDVMVYEAHRRQIRIEAWVNPYRVASHDSIEYLSKNNPAYSWMKNNSRNVLACNNMLYYNPSSAEVRELICNGVREITEKYDVDGIHLDDYFYPEFEKGTEDTTFDAEEYHAYKKSAKNDKLLGSSMSLADWRRDNVNQLIRQIYEIVHQKEGITFGISPAGNLDNLRSPYGNYVDIDTWVKEAGYVDYIMPQIYWGFTNDTMPFDECLKQWERLMRSKADDVKLYIGLPVYRFGSTDASFSDLNEFQNDTFITRSLSLIDESSSASGYSLFSMMYLDPDNPVYSGEFAHMDETRRQLLNDVAKQLKSR